MEPPPFLLPLPVEVAGVTLTVTDCGTVEPSSPVQVSVKVVVDVRAGVVNEPLVVMPL